MTNFTDNYLERLMRQKPLPGKRESMTDTEEIKEQEKEESFEKHNPFAQLQKVVTDSGFLSL
jgi:hypothetical protein